MSRTTDHTLAALETQQAQLGMRVAARLNEGASALPHDISERLRVSREQALSRTRQLRLQPAAADSAVGITKGGAAVLGHGPRRWWLGIASSAPLAVLVAGLVTIQLWTEREQVLAAAEIDAVLLADDLPPNAYTDPGFREFLKAPRP